MIENEGKLVIDWNNIEFVKVELDVEKVFNFSIREFSEEGSKRKPIKINCIVFGSAPLFSSKEIEDIKMLIEGDLIKNIKGNLSANFYKGKLNWQVIVESLGVEIPEFIPVKEEVEDVSVEDDEDLPW